MSGRHSRSPRNGTAAAAVRAISPRSQIDVAAGAVLTVLVLACNAEDTIGIDLASGALLRVRIPWEPDQIPNFSPFNVIEVELADPPQRDDLAQPEAVTTATMPTHIGTYRGRRVRHLLANATAPLEKQVLGFPGASAPYWEFTGLRPSLALVVATKGPVLFRRSGDRTVWMRFGWGSSDNWMPVDDNHAGRALDVARRDRLQGKDLSSALGFKPHFLLCAVSTPHQGHCYKTVRTILPRN